MVDGDIGELQLEKLGDVSPMELGDRDVVISVLMSVTCDGLSTGLSAS